MVAAVRPALAPRQVNSSGVVCPAGVKGRTESGRTVRGALEKLACEEYYFWPKTTLPIFAVSYPLKSLI